MRSSDPRAPEAARGAVRPVLRPGELGRAPPVRHLARPRVVVSGTLLHGSPVPNTAAFGQTLFKLPHVLVGPAQLPSPATS